MKNNSSTLLSKKKQKEEQLFIESIVEEVTSDFALRQKERLTFERQWELNMNFLRGKQYCSIDSRGMITDDDKEFYWQNREVYNHIAPIVETRLAKFSRVQPTVFVRPDSDDDKDVSRATASEKIIADVFKKNKIQEIVKTVTSWSEICGTAFYKVVWDNLGGNKLGEYNGQEVFEGEVKIFAVSPFEIFPDSLYNQKIDDCQSVIHAKALPVKQIFEKYGVQVDGEDIDVYSLTSNSSLNNDCRSHKLGNSAVVIERYERPTKEFPNGRLITVAGGKLLYYGDLPYVNERTKERCLPFVKQDCLEVSGSFFGASIVERLIPVQRAFNAVKNRKHEFMNRLSTGIMAVEDGSIDTDDLSSEGLPPGKVLVYRQGAKAPEMMAETALPADFNQEEDKLLNEFVIISGVSDVASSKENATVTSGSALQILIEQDTERLIVHAEIIRNCYLEIAKQTIKLYAQFGSGMRAVKYQDSVGKTKYMYVNGANGVSEDVYLESENELMQTVTQRKEMVFKLYQSGLLTDEKGNLRHSTKEKVLSLLGYKDLDYQKGLSRLQEEKAQQENLIIRNTGLAVEDIDDHSIHIDEHTRYTLSEYSQLNQKEKDYLTMHIKEHKQKLKDEQQVINKEN